MIDRSEKVKAGIFVLISAVLLTLIVFLVAGLRLFKTSTTYYVLFSGESVTGLEASSTVRYSGVPVGRVAAINFDADAFPDILVTIEVEPGTPIRRNTTAQLKPQGITEIYYIDLAGGAPAEPGPDGAVQAVPLLPENGTIQADASVTVQIMETLSGIGKVVKNLNDLLEENRSAISSAVSEIELAAREARTSMVKLDDALTGATELTRELRLQLSDAITSARSSLAAVEKFVNNPEIQAIPGKVGGFFDRASRVAERAESVAERAEEALSAVRVDEAVKRLEETFIRLRDIEDEVALAVRQLKLGIAENRGSVMRTTAHIQEFARNLKILSKEIRQQPSRLFFGQTRTDRKEEGR